MSPKKPKPSQGNLKSKSNSKLQKYKKKRKRKKLGRAAFSYNLLPKRKRLAKKAVTKLDSENKEYALARGIDTIKRLDQGKAVEGANEIPTLEERQWREMKRKSAEHKIWRENKIVNIRNREIKRRKKAAEKKEKELTRKKYRLHPVDRFHSYVPGYQKGRHRINKARFMTCVDVPLFQDVLNSNKELQDSPLWSEKLHLQNLSVEKAKQLKDHLYQFDVLVEALKQGIFDLPGCNDFPIHKVRRKKKKATEDGKQPTKNKTSKSRRRSTSSTRRHKELKRRLSFPPFEASEDDLLAEIDNANKSRGVIKGALSRMAKWIGDQKSTIKRQSQILNEDLMEIPPSEGNVPPTSTMLETTDNEKEKEPEPVREIPIVSNTFQWAKKTSLKSFPPVLKKHSMAMNMASESGEPNEYDDFEHNPFADLLTISVPTEPLRQKRFIRAIVERKNRDTPKSKSKSIAEAIKREEEEARQRHERMEKLDPLQRLHQDEKDSDIWTLTTTTTTDGYASWRRPRDLRNTGNKQDILAHKVDTSFAWRAVLFLIIIWEIGSFVKAKLDDIYYWIFTSHLYRENIWVFEPTLFPHVDKYYVLHIQEWVHLIISCISSSIIHRQNECVSLLFAFSLLIDGVIDVLVSTHDYVYLPDPIDWICVVLTAMHILWKAFIICLFIGYHYYSAGYIRKAREFKHRKTKLHNHEIKAKGTKGLQKRRMAWSWMTRHARNTNLKRLKQKFPNVKDGNFPEDELAKEIKFSETKELRLYTLKHSLNIGYPYNKLRDMKRYVFDWLEKSDYTENDDMTENDAINKKISKIVRRSSRGITLKKWKEWKTVKDEEEMKKRQTLSETQNKNENTTRKTINSRGPNVNLTIDPAFSHRELFKH